MFCEAREKMRRRITLKKKSDPGQFAISCTVQGIEFPHALCDTGASVSILPRVMTDLGLQLEPRRASRASIDGTGCTSIDGTGCTSIDCTGCTSIDHNLQALRLLLCIDRRHWMCVERLLLLRIDL
ncbi:hypothetical protein DY000_02024661 [Brassica cretica]|uniref:Peptidase A2 domain-containing protein n=1 Tax=Brassica cretica TaxID=69181 RepID=A0ABQ7E3I0_BRACR|nr:hypothetical protein DY000_02024661 [Brassica cretica]